MGTYNKGILGAFSGKVGPVVGANWRGLDTIRSLPKKSRRIPTENQLLQRLKFKAATQFLTPIHPVLGRYFGNETGEKTKKNLAMSYHMKEAMVFDGTAFGMVYSKVQISRGDLLGPLSPEVTAKADAGLYFQWADNSGQATASPTDRLVVVLYEPTSQMHEVFLDAGQRQDLEATVTLPSYFSGTTAECWITFVSETGKLYATSIYMGAVNVQ